MIPLVYIAVGALVLAAIYLLWKAAAAYRTFRGARLVTCPETGKPAGVEVDAGRAALTAVGAAPVLRLIECSRWPERAGCGQECLRQLEAAPENCLVRSILAKWYHGKSCTLCRKPFGEINWLEHKPCLMDAGGKTREWSEIRAEDVPETLATHSPVCWDCHIAETFRAAHPELVTDRDWKTARRTG